jgi:hypothetical protein
VQVRNVSLDSLDPMGGLGFSERQVKYEAKLALSAGCLSAAC